MKINGDWNLVAENKTSDQTFIVDWKMYVNAAPTVPDIYISSSEGVVTTTRKIPFDITFSMEVVDFDTSDIEVTNGKISEFNGSGSIYSIIVEPDAQGDVIISISSGSVQSTSQTFNNRSVSSSIYFNEIPSVVVRSDLQSPTNSSSINIEIEFSEDVIGFDSLDVVLTNALLNSFQGDKKNYQLIINPVDFGMLPSRFLLIPPKILSGDLIRNQIFSQLSIAVFRRLLFLRL